MCDRYSPTRRSCADQIHHLNHTGATEVGQVHTHLYRSGARQTQTKCLDVAEATGTVAHRARDGSCSVDVLRVEIDIEGNEGSAGSHHAGTPSRMQDRGTEVRPPHGI